MNRPNPTAIVTDAGSGIGSAIALQLAAAGYHVVAVGGGTIVNISSVADRRAIPLGGVAYNASKFAVTALGTTVGEEEKEHGIRVTNIYPGEVETPILDARPVPVSAEHRARILQPEDVAEAVMLACTLPSRARIPELTIVPTTQSFV